MKTSSTINRIATIVGLSLGAFGLSVVAQTWTPAPPNAPSGNVAAPINIGSVLQTRIGDLIINGALNVGGLGILSSNYVFKPSAAAVTVGSVLTAKDTGGTVEWKASGGSNTALAGLCTTTGIVPYNASNQSYRGITSVSMIINGKNICTDDNGCSYRIWSTNVSNPEGSNFYGTNPIMFRQMPSNSAFGPNKWIDASGNQSAVNGDSVNVKLVDAWGGLSLYDDYGYAGTYVTNKPLPSVQTGYSGAWWIPSVGNGVQTITGYAENSPDTLTAVVTGGYDAYLLTLCDF